MRVVHIYAMKPEPQRVRVIAPKHSAYWRQLCVRGYQGGPFHDRSGGLITFETDSSQEAEQLIRADPFVQEDLLESSWVKEWLIDA
jgi:uncharacterized protein YciI